MKKLMCIKTGLIGINHPQKIVAGVIYKTRKPMDSRHDLLVSVDGLKCFASYSSFAQAYYP